MKAESIVAPCLKTPRQKPAAGVAHPPIKPWYTREEMAAIAARQPKMSWEEKKAQINRSLGRPIDSD